MWGEQRLDALPMKNSGCVVVQSEVWRKTNGHGHGFAVGSRSAAGVQRFGEITNFVLICSPKQKVHQSGVMHAHV